MALRKPTNALRVQDLEWAVQFYHQGLGYHLDFRAEGVAQVSPPGGVPLLLARADLPEIDSYMYDTFSEVPKSKRIYCIAWQDLHQYRADLVARGLTPEPVAENADGSHTMLITDPEGYTVSFWEALRLTDAEIVQRFADAPRLLAEALDGLTEAQLDLVRAPGKWSIRQTVHHMCDSASSTLVRLLMALAEPGRPFRSNPYNQDRWVDKLDHAHRPIGSAVALLTAIHEHVAILVRHLDNPLDRCLEADLAGRVTVRMMLSMLGSHVRHHSAQIRETRQVHGV